MDLPPLSTVVVATAAVLVGIVVVVVALRGLIARQREGGLGALVAVDVGASPVLRSRRYRLSGRPDVLRRLPDGTVVPVEVKSRPTPMHGPLRSHQVQIAAYCLLVEEATGRSPPFGVLRYSDGGEFQLPWGATARRELLALREEIDRPYDGRATPSRAKCARCSWCRVCDASAANA